MAHASRCMGRSSVFSCTTTTTTHLLFAIVVAVVPGNEDRMSSLQQESKLLKENVSRLTKQVRVLEKELEQKNETMAAWKQMYEKEIATWKQMYEKEIQQKNETIATWKKMYKESASSLATKSNTHSVETTVNQLKRQLIEAADEAKQKMVKTLRELNKSFSATEDKSTEFLNRVFETFVNFGDEAHKEVFGESISSSDNSSSGSDSKPTSKKRKSDGSPLYHEDTKDGLPSPVETRAGDELED